MTQESFRNSLVPDIPQVDLTSTFQHPLTYDSSSGEVVDEVWLVDTRKTIPEGQQSLIYQVDGVTAIHQLELKMTRLGRSLTADVRFDDASVSRRHAIMVRQLDEIQILDDRSRNGIFVNGEKIESSTLADGDRITLGRHQLYYVNKELITRF
jgi:pSer/pThr/pTyr-binding forkhead associated (FHA) protein